MIAGLSGRVQLLGAQGLELVPDRLKLLASGRRQVQIDGETLDPGIQLLLRIMRLRGSPSFIRPGAADPVVERRRTVADARISQGSRTPVGEVSERWLGDEGAALRARHYVPRAGRETATAQSPLPLIMFAHGGGWVVGDLETHDELCRLLCEHVGAHVLAIEYPLAPEQRFPAQVDAVAAAARWTMARAAELGADPARVALAGDSAGGNLVAVACQILAREDGPSPALQVLIYPGTDFTRSYPSEELFREGFYLDQRSRDWCHERYLPTGVDLADPRLSPIHGQMDGLPAAIVVTAAFDPLRDEGEAYAEALREAGVDVVCHRLPGMIHGCMNMTGVSRGARDAALQLAGMIRTRL